MTIWNKNLVCGYSTGQISIFDLINSEYHTLANCFKKK
jgi:hypothetical protein